MCDVINHLTKLCFLAAIQGLNAIESLAVPHHAFPLRSSQLRRAVNGKKSTADPNTSPAVTALAPWPPFIRAAIIIGLCQLGLNPQTLSS